MARQSLSRFLPWLVTAPAAVLAWPFSAWASAGLGVLFVLGWMDFKQNKQAVRRNYPLTGRLRYGLEYIRPEMRQYFLEDDEQKLPFSRNQRAMVYARSKVQNDKRGFGSIKDMYNPNTEWIAHSLQPEQPDPASFRIRVGGTQCTQAYDLSLLNISGMSFGALSPNAVKALNKGAARGQFAHDTGEGSISAHHREHGGDLIWQIASGYFGCRTQDGLFDPERFALQALGEYDASTPARTRKFYRDGLSPNQLTQQSAEALRAQARGRADHRGAGERAAGAQDAAHFRKGAVAVGHVAQAEGHRDGVKRRVGQRQAPRRHGLPDAREPSLRQHVAARAGDVADALVKYAEGNQVSMVILGAATHGLQMQRFVATVPIKVAMEAPCTVILVKQALPFEHLNA